MGTLCSFSEALLHMFNKNMSAVPAEFRPLLEGKSSCMLLGDGMGDLTMANGLDAEVLKIGFLNEKVDEKLDMFRQAWDVVVLHDGPVPHACFRCLGLQGADS